jgi:hypothetical protein
MLVPAAARVQGAEVLSEEAVARGLLVGVHAHVDVFPPLAALSLAGVLVEVVLARQWLE